MVLVMCKGEHHKPSLPTAFYHPKDAYKPPSPPPYVSHTIPSHHEHHHHHAHHEYPTSLPSYAYEHPTTTSYEYNQPSYPYQYQTAEEPSYHGSSSEYDNHAAEEACAVHHVTVWEQQCSTYYRCTHIQGCSFFTVTTIKVL